MFIPVHRHSSASLHSTTWALTSGATATIAVVATSATRVALVDVVCNPIASDLCTIPAVLSLMSADAVAGSGFESSRLSLGHGDGCAKATEENSPAHGMEEVHFQRQVQNF